MIAFEIVVGIFALVFGYLLLFSYPTLKKMSEVFNRVVFHEDILHKYRFGLGLLLLGLSFYLFATAYAIWKAV